MFRIPEEKLHENGLKRKLYLEKYNLYKKRLRAIAAELGFDLLDEYFRVPDGMYLQFIFYIPVPRSWRIWKRTEMHLKKHHSTPDWDNYAKALCDGLIPQRDKLIADVRVTKLWFYDPSSNYYQKFDKKGPKPQPNGYIELWHRVDD